MNARGTTSSRRKHHARRRACAGSVFGHHRAELGPLFLTARRGEGGNGNPGARRGGTTRGWESSRPREAEGRAGRVGGAPGQQGARPQRRPGGGRGAEGTPRRKNGAACGRGDRVVVTSERLRARSFREGRATNARAAQTRARRARRETTRRTPSLLRATTRASGLFGRDTRPRLPSMGRDDPSWLGSSQVQTFSSCRSSRPRHA